jgi:hypothetical protein
MAAKSIFQCAKTLFSHYSSLLNFIRWLQALVTS